MRIEDLKSALSEKGIVVMESVDSSTYCVIDLRQRGKEKTYYMKSKDELKDYLFNICEKDQKFVKYVGINGKATYILPDLENNAKKSIFDILSNFENHKAIVVQDDEVIKNRLKVVFGNKEINLENVIVRCRNLKMGFRKYIPEKSTDKKWHGNYYAMVV